jgi:beta-carotene 3-hydroxylase
VTAAVLAVTALIVMEPITTLVHRLVFHGFAMGWHRSHHLPPRRRVEANDLFPVVFAVVTIGMLSIGVWVGAGSVLVPVGIGVTGYGAAYLVVHDLVIHRRLTWLRVPDRIGGRLRRAHNVHHLFGQAPFGFLAPVVPRSLQARADARGVDDTPRAVSRRYRA